MAMTCARCGAQNPDGNRFCQSCGTPLTANVPAPMPAAAAAAPMTAYASPPSAPAGYQSPYYSPTGAAQAPVHRTPWVLIISAVVVLLVVMAGGGTLIALIGSHAAGNTNGGGLVGGVSSPSPEGSPSPFPTPVTSGGSTSSNAGETIPVPAGWAVDSKDSETITLSNPDGDGSVTVGSGPSSPTQTAQQNKDTIDKFFEGKYPDTKTCPNSKTTTGNLNGAAGIFWELCFTLVSGGQSFQAAAQLFAGANSGGGVYYVVMLITTTDNLQALIKDAGPILAGIQWKLK